VGPPAQLLEIDRSSLRDRARNAIRGSIISGELEEGVIYPVTYFADRLGVSTTPIREALFDLAGEGLIELARNRGFQIPYLSEQDLDELFQLRLMVELEATVLVAKGRLLRDRAALSEMVDQIVDHARAGAVVEFLHADRTFHLQILASLGNVRLVDFVGLLRDQARLQGLRHLAETGRLLDSGEEHRAILDSVASGNGAATARLMRLHLSHTRGLWAGRQES
jgi:DNA-binding GntR family transcriptional regulator